MQRCTRTGASYPCLRGRGAGAGPSCTAQAPRHGINSLSCRAREGSATATTLAELLNPHEHREGGFLCTGGSSSPQSPVLGPGPLSILPYERLHRAPSSRRRHRTHCVAARRSPRARAQCSDPQKCFEKWYPGEAALQPEMVAKCQCAGRILVHSA